MADTLIVDLVSTQWRLITAASDGFITNESNKKVVYREAASLPAANLNTGHTLEDVPGAFFQFTLVSGQELYGRTVGGPGMVAVTPGDS